MARGARIIEEEETNQAESSYCAGAEESAAPGVREVGTMTTRGGGGNGGARMVVMVGRPRARVRGVRSVKKKVQFD